MKFFASSLLAIAVAGCATMPEATAPLKPAEFSVDPKAAEDALVADLVSRMSVERKVAQLIQPQINSFTAEDMERYRFGSYLNGGNGGPYGDELAPASEWLRLADEMYDASVKPLPGGEPAIPTMWGTDAVHGHTNVVGATIFPHNVAIGATRDPDLVRRIGAATALEIEATGIDWNFSPTVAVAQDDRWGRAYESYSEDPQLVATLGAALVEGLQGTPGAPGFLGDGKVIATAKHFFADGGTRQGVDTGDAIGDLAAIKAVHALPYPVAIDAGVQVVMSSFSSINGVKMHGNKELLTDYLRGELDFDGLVVGDWNGHGQVAGCSADDCPQSLNAGLDIYMVPDDWKALHENLVREVGDGTISMARLDEAVGRVLRVKYRAGILGDRAERPSERGVGGQFELLGSPEHRAIAREAVAKSQVILKNNGVLPLKAGANILVAGKAADSIATASGGWTLTWQGGGDLTNADFPGATSIYAGLAAAAKDAGGSAMLSPDGSYDTAPDVAIVVFGEKPYAEFAGDQKDLVLRDEEGLTLLRRYREAGIPTVAVFLSGRALWMNREINAADAFVASWLPGSEGAGVADVLTGARAATGRLGFSWPAHCEGKPANGPEGALFPVGFGAQPLRGDPNAAFDETCDVLERGPESVLFARGRLSDYAGAVALRLPGVPGDGVRLSQFLGSPAGTGIVVRGYDRNAQEDAREIRMEPLSSFVIGSNDPDDRPSYRIVYEVPNAPTGTVTVTATEIGRAGQTSDITDELKLAAGKGWREMIITSECLGDLDNKALLFRTESDFVLRIAEVVREEMPDETECSF